VESYFFILQTIFIYSRHHLLASDVNVSSFFLAFAAFLALPLAFFLLVGMVASRKQQVENRKIKGSLNRDDTML
jgi:hypothetical protein